KEKSLAIQRSKMTQYYNMGSFSIVEARGFLKAINPIFELTSVYTNIMPSALWVRKSEYSYWPFTGEHPAS
ncbi:MAG: hypothetical protein ACXU9U_01130, partial [Parachlamydiaceae bacterium]